MTAPPALGPTARIQSLLVKPVSAVCNLDCQYCFYLDREADPYKDLPRRQMSEEMLERLVDQYLFYSFPASVFAWQGGEPTLAGLGFFRRAVEFQKRFGRNGQSVSNAIQTNAILIDDEWCSLFREYSFLVGASLDGPEEVHDRYRWNKGRQGTWRKVMQGIEALGRNGVEFNILCVVSQANVAQARALYQWFRREGFEFIQYIPLAEFDKEGSALPFTVTPQQYGRFLVDTFDSWWPERRKVRVRFFDNILEALAGCVPGNCTMHPVCDSYVVVEHNGDVYPCDFFVEGAWKLGNIGSDSFPEIARRLRRAQFAAKKTLPREECSRCEFATICQRGCPKLRHAQRGEFGDLDYFCQAYKMIFAHALPSLRREAAKLKTARA
jgi:uncharacterized protein